MKTKKHKESNSCEKYDFSINAFYKINFWDFGEVIAKKRLTSFSTFWNWNLKGQLMNQRLLTFLSNPNPITAWPCKWLTDLLINFFSLLTLRKTLDSLGSCAFGNVLLIICGSTIHDIRQNIFNLWGAIAANVQYTTSSPNLLVLGSHSPWHPLVIISPRIPQIASRRLRLVKSLNCRWL